MSAKDRVVLPVTQSSRRTRCWGASRLQYLRDQHQRSLRPRPSICSRGCDICRESSGTHRQGEPPGHGAGDRHLRRLPAETTAFPAKSWRWRSRSTILKGVQFLLGSDGRRKEKTDECTYSGTRLNTGVVRQAIDRIAPRRRQQSCEGPIQSAFGSATEWPCRDLFHGRRSRSRHCR